MYIPFVGKFTPVNISTILRSMTYAELIEFYGTQSKAAAKLGFSRPTLSNWKARGAIPEGPQAWIQILTKNKLKADRPEWVPE